MSETLGPVEFASGSPLYLGGEEVRSRPYAEQTQRVDEEVAALLRQAEGRATAMLTEHRDALERLTDLLLERETVDGCWLLLAPSMRGLADGVDAWPLVPIPPSTVIEPTRAVVTRAEWNSILAGLSTLALAGSLLMADRRRQRRAPAGSADGRPRRRTGGGESRPAAADGAPRRGALRRRPGRWWAAAKPRSVNPASTHS